MKIDSILEGLIRGKGLPGKSSESQNEKFQGLLPKGDGSEKEFRKFRVDDEPKSAERKPVGNEKGVEAGVKFPEQKTEAVSLKPQGGIPGFEREASKQVQNIQGSAITNETGNPLRNSVLSESMLKAEDGNAEKPNNALTKGPIREGFDLAKGRIKEMGESSPGFKAVGTEKTNIPQKTWTESNVSTLIRNGEVTIPEKGKALIEEVLPRTKKVAENAISMTDNKEAKFEVIIKNIEKNQKISEPIKEKLIELVDRKNKKNDPELFERLKEKVIKIEGEKIDPVVAAKEVSIFNKVEATLEVKEWVNRLKTEIRQMIDFKIENENKIKLHINNDSGYIRIDIEKKNNELIITSDTSRHLKQRVDEILAEIRTEVRDRIQVKVETVKVNEESEENNREEENEKRGKKSGSNKSNE